MVHPEQSPNDRSQPAPLEIAHVLFMDIVAYSKLPMEEQTRLLSLLQKIVRDTADVSRAVKRRQLLLLPTGDGIALVFFGDPEASAHCALEISRALSNHTDLGLRMGLHTGPVQRVQDINANRNVSGGGINIAQRVMDCGDAGHILVSKSVADVLGQMSSWNEKLHDLGEVEVKHGVRVHLYNLYTDEAGNPALPQKFRIARKTVSRKKRKKVSFAVITAGMIAAFAIGGLLYSRRAHALTDKDTIVLADFTNNTGDPIFDDTLKQGLSVALSQSPFFNLMPDDKVSGTLKMMGRAPADRLTPEVAREVCMRTNTKAMLAGSISNMGSRYVIGVKAVHCIDGDVLAQEQVQATTKDEVLKALDTAAFRLRGKLGESVSSVQKFDVRLAEATTPSLDALKVYSVAGKVQDENGDAAAIRFYKQAIELDPNFALAYSSLGIAYSSLGEDGRASDNFEKAFQLRDRVTEHEKCSISSQYFSAYTGDLLKAAQEYELCARMYPRDVSAHTNLGFIHISTGQYAKAEAETVQAVRLNPSSYDNLMSIYIALDRLDEAKSVYQRALALKFDAVTLHGNRYSIAFLEHDAPEMERQLTWAAGNPGVEDPFLNVQSDTEAFYGRLRRAREFSRRAVDLARSNDQKQAAAQWALNGARREAELGNYTRALQQTTFALSLASTRDIQILAALTLARAGNVVLAESTADALEKHAPLNTVLNRYWLPAIRAAIEISRNRPNRALEFLQPSAAYELGAPPPAPQSGGTLFPIYLRGQAYLLAHQGRAAAAEYQKLLNHPGIVVNFPLGALAHLGLARARALDGNVPAARIAYQDFLTLWKDADPDIPILKQAKAEYAKLQ